MDEEIFKISKDPERAKDLFVMAKERMELVKVYPRNLSYKLIEEYYEVLKELMTALMYLDGWKTLSHMKLIEYTTQHVSGLNEKEIELLNTLRKFRNGIMYYGRRISEDFLINNEEDVHKVAKKLFDCVSKRL